MTSVLKCIENQVVKGSIFNTHSHTEQKHSLNAPCKITCIKISEYQKHLSEKKNLLKKYPEARLQLTTNIQTKPSELIMFQLAYTVTAAHLSTARLFLSSSSCTCLKTKANTLGRNYHNELHF